MENMDESLITHMSKHFAHLWPIRTGDEISLAINRILLKYSTKGDVTIEVVYSDVNYKDGLVCSSGGMKILPYPIPGIDLAVRLQNRILPT